VAADGYAWTWGATPWREGRERMSSLQYCTRTCSRPRSSTRSRWCLWPRGAAPQRHCHDAQGARPAAGVWSWVTAHRWVPIDLPVLAAELWPWGRAVPSSVVVLAVVVGQKSAIEKYQRLTAGRCARWISVRGKTSRSRAQGARRRAGPAASPGRRQFQSNRVLEDKLLS
jgi:hypothetical protein